MFGYVLSFAAHELVEIKKSNEKYYRMTNHYEKIIGELRKEIITLTTPDATEPTEETSMESRLIPLLCMKINKTEDEIKEKLVNYTLPEKLTSDDLKNILIYNKYLYKYL